MSPVLNRAKQRLQYCSRYNYLNLLRVRFSGFDVSMTLAWRQSKIFSKELLWPSVYLLQWKYNLLMYKTIVSENNNLDSNNCLYFTIIITPICLSCYFYKLTSKRLKRKFYPNIWILIDKEGCGINLWMPRNLNEINR